MSQLLIPAKAFAYDKLLIIQTVSISKKTFVIRKGFLDGIAVGQESLFTIRNAGVVASAIEVNRTMSIWEINDTRGTVTFEKGEYVTFSNSIENLILELPRLDKYAEKSLQFQPQGHWVVKGNISYALSDTVSETKSSSSSSRAGYQLELLYSINFSHRWDFGFGMRYDTEVQRISEPVIDVPTTRLMGVTELNYLFNEAEESKSFFYIGAGLGYGISTTSVDTRVSSGPVFLLPVLKFGYLNFIGAGKWMIMEAAVESLGTTESFTDGVEQTTTVVNSKISVGIKF